MTSRILRAALLCIPFALFACAGGAAEDGQAGDEQDIKKVKGNREGEICAGIAGFQCQAGLECRMSGPSHPDQSGVCSKPVAHCAEKLLCDPGMSPVDNCDVKDQACKKKTSCAGTIFCAPSLQCQAIATCASDEVQLDKCPAGDKDCHTTTLCGKTIACTKPQFTCAAFPSCGSEKVQVDSCDGQTDCEPVSLCGSTIHCARPQVQCQAFPSCPSGTVTVDECPTDTNKCSVIAMCGHAVSCLKK